MEFFFHIIVILSIKLVLIHPDEQMHIFHNILLSKSLYLFIQMNKRDDKHPKHIEFIHRIKKTNCGDKSEKLYNRKKNGSSHSCFSDLSQKNMILVLENDLKDRYSVINDRSADI